MMPCRRRVSRCLPRACASNVPFLVVMSTRSYHGKDNLVVAYTQTTLASGNAWSWYTLHASALTMAAAVMKDVCTHARKWFVEMTRTA